MYDYTIFSIKREIANHYFLKSDILYRFLEEYQSNQNRIDLQKQFLYITDDFKKKNILSILKDHFKDQIEIHPEGSMANIFVDQHELTLHIKNRELIFKTKSLQEAEEVLFPILRSIHPFFFIVGKTNRDYGWISPIKFPKENIKEQVLYSCQ